jgi:hypothetical protein
MCQRYWFLMFLLASAANTACAEDVEQLFLSNIRYMCEWAKTSAPGSNPVRIRACDPKENPSPKETDEDLAAWWKYWRDQDTDETRAFEKKWDVALEQHMADVDRKAKAAKRLAAEKRHAAQIAALPEASTEEVCRLARNRLVNEANAELSRRRAFAPRELELIAARQVSIGMSEGALLCSWGPPERANRSVGSWGVHIQYVYPGRKYIYTQNGKVTSWQD